MTSLRSYLLISVLGILAFTACKKKEKTTPGPAATLSAENQNPYPYEMVLLTGSGITYSQPNYSATIGGQTVTLQVYNEYLTFQVPNLAAGSYDLNTNVEGKDYTIHFDIKDKPVVNDPDQYVTDYNNQNANIKTDFHSLLQLLQTVEDTSVISSDFKRIETNFNTAMDRFNKASAEEKMQAALTIAANRSWMDELSQTVKEMNDNFLVLKLKKKEDDAGDELRAKQALLNQQYAKLKKDIAIGIGLTILGSVAGPTGAGLGALIGICLVSKDALNIHALSMEIAELKSQAESVDAHNKQGVTLALTRDSAVPYSLVMSFRSLTKADANSSESITKGVVNFVGEVADWVDKIKSLLGNDVIQSTPVRITDITTPLNSGTSAVTTQHLQVRNISNPAVTLKSMTDDVYGRVLFNFGSNKSGNQNFTFDLVYENPDITKLVTTVNGILKDPNDTQFFFYLTGGGTKSWKIDPSGKSTSCHSLINPPCMADNTWTFKSNGTFMYDPGTITNCSSNCGDGSASTQTFSISSDKKSVIIGGSYYTIIALSKERARLNVGGEEYDWIPR